MCIFCEVTLKKKKKKKKIPSYLKNVLIVNSVGGKAYRAIIWNLITCQQTGLETLDMHVQTHNSELWTNTSVHLSSDHSRHVSARCRRHPSCPESTVEERDDTTEILSGCCYQSDILVWVCVDIRAFKMSGLPQGDNPFSKVLLKANELSTVENLQGVWH